MELDAFLSQALIVLGAAVVVLLLAHRLRIPALVGLLFTGVLIGPSATGLVDDVTTIHLLAEIGVVFLLFTIGLELSLTRLAEVWRTLVLGGALQAVATGGLAAAVAFAAGWQPRSAIFLGFVLTLSSTAVVLKLYGDRRETASPHGQAGLAILLFQDFLIVPMIVLTPILGGEIAASPAELATRLGGAGLAIVAIFPLARWVMPRLLRQVVESGIRELFVLGALGVCLALSWLTHHLGFSLALGAFVAGILISETEYSHQVFADIAPFRDVFASLFFISVGMLVDLDFLAGNGVAVLGLAMGVVLLKATTTGLAVAALRFPARTVASVAFGLAQIGEFSFVLMEVGRAHGLLQGDRYQLLLSTAVLTLVVTPGLVRLGPALGVAWTRRLGRLPGSDPEAAERQGHVIIVGYGTVGTLLARVLRESRLPYCVIELNGRTVRRARAAGEPILYGDATRGDILENAGIARASAAVFAINDPAALVRAVSLARRLAPGLEIVVRTRMVREIEELQRHGADQVVADELETAIQVFTRVLERFRVPPNVIRAQTRVLHAEGYRMLRAPTARAGVSEAVLSALGAGTTEVFRVVAGGTAEGRSLGELELRRKSGASVLAVVRGDQPLPNPSAELRLAAGDDLVLVGSHVEIDAACELLR